MRDTVSMVTRTSHTYILATFVLKITTLSQLQILSIEVIECVKLSSTFLFGTHKSNFGSIVHDDLSLNCTVRLVALVAVGHVRFVVCVDVLHHEIVVTLLRHECDGLTHDVTHDYAHSDIVSIVLQQEASC